MQAHGDSGQMEYLNWFGRSLQQDLGNHQLTHILLYLINSAGRYPRRQLWYFSIQDNSFSGAWFFFQTPAAILFISARVG